jgi:hypothetical protein
MLAQTLLGRHAALHIALESQFFRQAGGGRASLAVAFRAAAEARPASRIDLLHELTEVALASLPTRICQILTLDSRQLFRIASRIGHRAALQPGLVGIHPGWLAGGKVRDAAVVYPLVRLCALGRRSEQHRGKHKHKRTVHLQFLDERR